MTRELLRPDKLDPSVSVDGMDYIDVPALGKSDYQLKFHSFKECTVLAKVHVPDLHVHTKLVILTATYNTQHRDTVTLNSSLL